MLEASVGKVSDGGNASLHVNSCYMTFLPACEPASTLAEFLNLFCTRLMG